MPERRLAVVLAQVCGAAFRGALCIVVYLLAPPALSSERWGGAVAAVSDYAYRGISQTRGAPALQVGLYRELPGGWSVGAWGSNVDFGRWNDTTYELNAHLTCFWSLADDWSAQLTYTRYFYTDQRAGYDYDELLASLTYRQRVTATIAWSPNVSLYSPGTMAWERQATSYELTVLQPIGPRWSLTAGAGHYDLTDLFDDGYWYWSAGIAFAWDSLQLDIVHIGTDHTARRLFVEDTTGSRLSAGLTWRF
jgi:uncharacterized protein (TIGR02001 family)